jgi:uncharacterized membrane protein required for colicin V production
VSPASICAFAAANVVDVSVLVALGLFLVWGSMHGALRQALGLVVVALGFLTASALASSLEPSVAKVADLDADARGAVAWLALWVLTVVVGGVVLHGLRQAIAVEARPSPASRASGAVVGLAKGILVLGVCLYGVLATFLESPATPPVEALRSSRTGAVLVVLERAVAPVLRLPRSVEDRVALANATIRRGRPGP